MINKEYKKSRLRYKYYRHRDSFILLNTIFILLKFTHMPCHHYSDPNEKRMQGVLF